MVLGCEVGCAGRLGEGREGFRVQEALMGNERQCKEA